MSTLPPETPLEPRPNTTPEAADTDAATRAENARVLREEAARAGFHRVGIASVEPWERHAVYRRWVESGRAADMGYLATQSDERRDVRNLLASARSIVTVGLSYAGTPRASGIAGSDGGHTDHAAGGEGSPRAFIARYARGADYHTVMKRALQKMAAAVAERLGRSVAWTACVDTAPVLEKEAAHRGGVGFQAKNTLVIAPGLGSYLMLGELLLDVEAAPDEAAEPRCGRCRACLDACPTRAFDDAYQLDARRCISYLTIENAGPIPRELRPAFENMVFGCDRCQEVCPFNNEPTLDRAPTTPELLPSPRRDAPELVRLLGLGAAQFRKLVEKSALRRIHRAQLLRNVAVALGNVGGANEIASLQNALSEKHELVRAHVAWALGRIALRSGNREIASRVLSTLREHRMHEADETVLAEIDQVLAELAERAAGASATE